MVADTGLDAPESNRSGGMVLDALGWGADGLRLDERKVIRAM